MTPLVPPPLMPIPLPAQVAARDRARCYWDHYVDTTAREALGPQDAVLLGQLCLVLDKRDAAFALMEAGGGLVVPAPTNAVPMPNQHYVAWRQLCGEAAKLAAQLCLTLRTVPPASQT